MSGKALTYSNELSSLDEISVSMILMKITSRLNHKSTFKCFAWIFTNVVHVSWREHDVDSKWSENFEISILSLWWLKFVLVHFVPFNKTAKISWKIQCSHWNFKGSAESKYTVQYNEWHVSGVSNNINVIKILYPNMAYIQNDVHNSFSVI